ncbi:antibiotic biosynthesis monooxygenase family protein [Neisseria sp. Ec49-e6-T10]|uniref:antibiotic biosynthesis monooxygenase family protein n=1 Tax=Neisseria sp. Ec49-e6-T10 TaxID=3140744 RepID=UPI003EBB45F3
MIANTPKVPYYAVIFTSIRTSEENGYSAEAIRMFELVSEQDGFLGVESAREGIGITVSYWRDLESIKKWKENFEHSLIRDRGRAQWYQSFKVRIALVERDYQFEKQ